MPSIKIEREKCKGCGICISVCPQQIIALADNINSQGYRYALVSDRPRCIGCRLCALSCPDVAIEVYAEGTVYNFYQYGGPVND